MLLGMVKMFAFTILYPAQQSAAPRPESLADFANMHKSYYDKPIAKEYCLYCGDPGG